MREGFSAFWRHRFADIPPIGFVLRQHLEVRWVRFHSLPGSKRYADNDPERRTILARANTLAGEIFASSEQCWLVANLAQVKGSTWHPQPVGVEWRLEPAFRSEKPYVLDEEYEWCTYAGRCVWHHGRFDGLIARIADDGVRAVIWVSQTSGAVFAPYDGGVDIIMPTAEAAGELRREHPAWLPDNSEGL